jgi:hypothetical protein
MSNLIKATKVKMKEAIKIFNAGASKQTIMNLLDIDELEYYKFIKMMLGLIIYYEEGGKRKQFPLYQRSKTLHSVLRDMDMYLIDEDSYGGVQGKLPEYSILSESDETVGNYKQ